MNTGWSGRCVAWAVFASLIVGAVATAAAAPAPRRTLAPAIGGAVDVVLTACDAKRRDEVAAALERAGVSAAEAKHAVAKPPAVVKRGLKPKEAEALKAQLTAAGATIEVRAAEREAGRPRLPAGVRYDVVLLGHGPGPSRVVAALRAIAGIDEGAAIALVDRLPSLVKADVPQATARDIERQLAAAGADAEARPAGGALPAPTAAAAARYFVVLAAVPEPRRETIAVHMHEMFSMGLDEARRALERLPWTYRTGVAAPVARDRERILFARGATVEIWPVDKPWDVWLSHAGPNRSTVVRTVQRLTGLGGAEANRLVDAAPARVRAGLMRLEADEAMQALRDAGATAELR